MARYAGTNADFWVGGANVGGVNKWALDDEVPELDVTGFDTISPRGEFIAGRPGTTGSFSGHWESTEALLSGAPPALSAGMTGVVVRAYLNSGGQFFDLIVNITNMHYEADEGGIVDFSGTFRVTTLTAYPV
jgi:hypothetical protein